MQSFALRVALLFSGPLFATLTLGCGAPLLQPAVDSRPPLNRAALTDGLGASLEATFLLPMRQLQSTSGSPALTIADLDAVTLYLVEAPIGAPPTGALSPVSDSGFTYTLDAANRTSSRVDVRFTNVPGNAPGKAYFLAVSADGDGRDITNTAAPATIGARRCYVSHGGGSLVDPGSVRVEPVTYTLDAASPLTAELKLLDAKSATLQASVTISDGGDAP